MGFIAVTSIRHGEVQEDGSVKSNNFEPGDDITGLDKETLKTLYESGSIWPDEKTTAKISAVRGEEHPLTSKVRAYLAQVKSERENPSARPLTFDDIFEDAHPESLREGVTPKPAIAEPSHRASKSDHSE
jgi:hypothetical protein